MEQRPIKFRAWVKSTQRMVAPHSLYNILKRTDELAANLVPEEEIIWMQFTGLLDKNGREIYEYDIVSFQNNSMSWSEVLGYVEFDNNRGSWTFNDLPIDQKTSPTGTTYWGATFVNSFDSGTHSPENVAVIGNIFENPELLKNQP